MATDFKLPELGENIDSGTIARVLVSDGDSVDKGQSILEVETDKAVVEVPSPAAGTIEKLSVKDGDTIKVGQLICSIGGEGKAKAEAPAEAAPAEEKKAKPAPSKAEAAPPKLQVLDKPAPAPEKAQAAPAAKRAGGAVLASPTVRRLARELGVDLKEVPTADPSGRVTAQDVQQYAQGGDGGAAAAAPAARKAAAAPAAKPSDVPTSELDGGTDTWGAVAYEPMNAIRKKTAERMAQNWTTIPHVTHFEKADITALEDARKKHGKAIEAEGGKLTVTSFILKVLAEALKTFPKFNASVDLDGQQLVLKQYYNIGIAADTPHGLLVPVIRDVDQKSVRDLSIELPALAARARERKLSIDEMQGGTFTVSNLGGLGGHSFTPIINAPEVAILGVSRASFEPVLQQGQFVPRLMLPLSLSYDHRVIDGADAARFSHWIVEALEQPWSLFINH